MTDKRSGQKAAPRPCVHCGEIFSPCIRHPQGRFCSPSCQWKATRGPEFNARIARESAAKRGDNLRGKGKGKNYGYIKRNGRHEHRVIAEQQLGRALLPGEIVHHRDENKSHNSPDNLQVLPNQAEHARIHSTGRRQSPETIRKRMEATKRTKAARKAQQ